MTFTVWLLETTTLPVLISGGGVGGTALGWKVYTNDRENIHWGKYRVIQVCT